MFWIDYGLLIRKTMFKVTGVKLNGEFEVQYATTIESAEMMSVGLTNEGYVGVLVTDDGI